MFFSPDRIFAILTSMWFDSRMNFQVSSQMTWGRQNFWTKLAANSRTINYIWQVLQWVWKILKYCQIMKVISISKINQCILWTLFPYAWIRVFSNYLFYLRNNGKIDICKVFLQYESINVSYPMLDSSKPVDNIHKQICQISNQDFSVTSWKRCSKLIYDPNLNYLRKIQL